MYKLWCLGNEMDGPWQIGHKTAEEYGRLATETAKLMRLVDPTHRARRLRHLEPRHAHLRRLGGHCARSTATSYVDYLSLHSYYGKPKTTGPASWRARPTWTASSTAAFADADQSRAKSGSRKRINLWFDEWNVWHREAEHAGNETGSGRRG